MNNTTTNTALSARKGAPTIIDVAERAKVAVGTVSRYLNGMPVRAGNREAIERAVTALGYKHNKMAAAMKTKATHIVGLMVPVLCEFHAALLEQLTRKMRLRERAVLCYCHDMQPRSMVEGLEFFASYQVDALVIAGDEAIRTDLRLMIEKGLPVVLFNNDMPDLLVDRVFAENHRASVRVVEHLIELGHERIAVVHGNLRDTSARERLSGFLDACQAHGIGPSPELIIDGNWSESGGHEAAGRLLALDKPPTAIFSCNYAMTVGVLTHLRERNISVPQDMSVVGFDDVSALRLHYPAVTTVGQPIEKMAEAITSTIDTRLMDNSTSLRRATRIDCDIILRNSARRLK